MSNPAGPEQEARVATETGDRSIRVTSDVHRQLLTLQYHRKIAGESVSFSEIIGQLLDRAGAALWDISSMRP